MSVNLDNLESTLIARASKGQNSPVPAVQTPETNTAEANVSAGERHLNRLKLNGSYSLEEEPTTTTATASTSSSEDISNEDPVLVQQSALDQMFDLMTKAAVNLGTTLNSIAQITTLTSEQGSSSVEFANKSQANLNEQLDEQAKREKHMKMLSWGIRILAVTILVVAVVTGQPELAPLSTLLMTSLSGLLIMKPDLLTNQLINPLSSALQSIGVPEKYATLLANVIVITATVAATAGVGAAADSATLGRAVTEQVGRTTARTMLEEGTFNYAKLEAGNALIATSTLVGVTQPINKTLTDMFPNHPLIAQIVGTTLTLLVVASAAVGGTALLGSSGYLSSGSKQLEVGAMAVADGLRLTEGVAQGGSAYMTFEQGNLTLKLAETQADLNIAQSCASTSATLGQTAQSTMELVTETMSQLSAAIESITTPGEAYSRYAG